MNTHIKNEITKLEQRHFMLGMLMLVDFYLERPSITKLEIMERYCADNSCNLDIDNGFVMY